MLVLVSIIVPSYNRFSLISETLDSVLTQTNPYWECIIVDDGSTDGTWQVLEKYAAKDERIRIYKRDRQPKGANTCRNMGAQLAQGRYLLFLDSDDLLAPWCIEDRLVKVATKPKQDFYLFPAANFSLNPRVFTLFFPDTNDDFLDNFLTLKRMFQTSSTFWDNDFFRSVTFDEKLPCWQDCDIHIRALIKSKKYHAFFTIPDVFIRKQSSIESQVTNSYNIDYAQILHEYAWIKILSQLPEKRKGTFKHWYLSAWTDKLESYSYKQSMHAFRIALNSSFFDGFQKIKLFVYFYFYFLFKFLKLPNIPYRLRGLFGIRRRANTSNRLLHLEELRLIKSKLSSIPNSPVSSLFLEV